LCCAAANPGTATISASNTDFRKAVAFIVKFMDHSSTENFIPADP
jgi:hypothetical protein